MLVLCLEKKLLRKGTSPLQDISYSTPYRVLRALKRAYLTVLSASGAHLCFRKCVNRGVARIIAHNIIMDQNYCISMCYIQYVYLKEGEA